MTSDNASVSGSPLPSTMRAVVLERPGGGPETLEVQTLPVPVPAPGWVLIRVRAAGLNRSELHTRLGLASQASVAVVTKLTAAPDPLVQSARTLVEHSITGAVVSCTVTVKLQPLVS